MTAAVLLVVGALSIGQSEASMSWLTEYTPAQQAAVKARRPVAVFFGAGADGYLNARRDGKLDAETVRLLTAYYVCVYLDVAKPANQELVSAFEIKSGKGVVLSDRSGDVQVFHHDGALPARELTAALQRHAGVAAAVPAAATSAATKTSAASKTIILTSANFEVEVLQNPLPVLVDFYADWCGRCRSMGPIVAELGADFRGVASVGKLNTDQQAALASKYNISAIPAFVIFHNGQVVDRFVGGMSKADLAARLSAVVKK